MSEPKGVPGIVFLPLVVPLLMAPAGVVIYFTEGRNLVQLLAIEAFACACPVSLWMLIGFVVWSARFARTDPLSRD